MNKKLALFIFSLVFLPVNVAMAYETTAYGKITGIESRIWGLHVQTTFSGGGSLGCQVNVGETIMYDFRDDNTRNSPDAKTEKAMLLAAFVAGKDVSFHLYECNSGGTRPIIGYIRIK